MGYRLSNKKKKEPLLVRALSALLIFLLIYATASSVLYRSDHPTIAIGDEKRGQEFLYLIEKVMGW